MSTLVSGGRAASAITSQLSKPTMATSPGTPRPRSRSASAAPRAIWSLPQKSASGGAAAVEEPGDGLAAPGLRPDAGQVEARQLRQPGGGERRPPAGAAQAHRLEVLRPGDVGDAAAAEPGQVLDREHRPALVVRQQAERAGIVGVGEDVDHGQPVGERADRRPGVGAAGGHHQPVDALAQQLVEVLALAGRVVGGVAHEDGDALVGQPLLQRLDDRDGEAAEAVVRDDADGLRAGAAQAVRQVVRAVADLVARRA